MTTEEQLAKLLEQQTAIIQHIQQGQANPVPWTTSPMPQPTGISIPVKIDGLRPYIHFGPESANWQGLQRATLWIQSQGFTLDILRFRSRTPFTQRSWSGATPERSKSCPN